MWRALTVENVMFVTGPDPMSTWNLPVWLAVTS